MRCAASWARRGPRDLAGEHVNAMLAELREAIVASGHDGASLARAADELAGIEPFLMAQNDAVRLQVSAEAEALRAQNRQLPSGSIRCCWITTSIGARSPGVGRVAQRVADALRRHATRDTHSYQ